MTTKAEAAKGAKIVHEGDEILAVYDGEKIVFYGIIEGDEIEMLFAKFPPEGVNVDQYIHDHIVSMS